jgi:hypothetical protein
MIEDDDLSLVDTSTQLEEETQTETNTGVVEETQTPPAPEIDYAKLADALYAKAPQQSQQQVQQQQSADPYEGLADVQYDAPAFGRALVQLAVQEITGQLAPVIGPMARSHTEDRLLRGLSDSEVAEVRSMGDFGTGMTDEVMAIIRDAAVQRAAAKSGISNQRPPAGTLESVGRVDNFQTDTKTSKALNALDQLAVSLTGKGLDKAALLKRVSKN